MVRDRLFRCSAHAVRLQRRPHTQKETDQIGESSAERRNATVISALEEMTMDMTEQMNTRHEQWAYERYRHLVRESQKNQQGSMLRLLRNGANRRSDRIRLTSSSAGCSPKPGCEPVVRISVEAGPAAGEFWVATPGEYILGRCSQPPWNLGNDGPLSRVHARLTVRPDGEVWVTDLGSTGGTFINGERIDGPCPIQTEEWLTLGSTTLNIDPQRRVASGRGYQTPLANLEDLVRRLLRLRLKLVWFRF